MASLRGSTRPMFIVRSTSTQTLTTADAGERNELQREIALANLPAAECLGIPIDELLGLSLKSETADTRLAWLHSTVALENNHCQILPNSDGKSWFGIAWANSISESLRLYIRLQNDDPLAHQLQTHPQWDAIKTWQNVLSKLPIQNSLRRLPSLIGNHPKTQLALQRAQLATQNSVGIYISGSIGTGKLELATAIARHHSRDQINVTPPTIIDGRLIDLSLLKDLLQLVSQQSQLSENPKQLKNTLILTSVDRWPADCVTTLQKFLLKNSERLIICTGETPHLETVHNQTQKWQELAAKLTAVNIDLINLHHRCEDIFSIISQQLTEFAQVSRPTTSKSLVSTISDEALQMMKIYTWPSNIAELSAAINYAIKRCSSGVIEPQDLPLAIRTFASTSIDSEQVEPLPLDDALLDLESRLLKKALDAFPQNRAAAARHLGISRSRFLRRIEQLGLVEKDKDAVEKSDDADEPIFREIES